MFVLRAWKEYVINVLPLSNDTSVISELYDLSSCITEQIYLFLPSQLSARQEKPLPSWGGLHAEAEDGLLPEPDGCGRE